MKVKNYKTTFGHSIEGDEEIEYEVVVSGTIQPSEPDVGIMGPYVEDLSIESIVNLTTEENLHHDNWPFQIEDLGDIELEFMEKITEQVEDARMYAEEERAEWKRDR